VALGSLPPSDLHPKIVNTSGGGEAIQISLGAYLKAESALNKAVLKGVTKK
jgi:hypothetical protein